MHNIAKLFWENPEHKVLFNKATNNVSRFHRTKEKIKFLKLCEQNNVIPVTLSASFKMPTNLSNSNPSLNSASRPSSMNLSMQTKEELINLVQDLQSELTSLVSKTKYYS